MILVVTLIAPNFASAAADSDDDPATATNLDKIEMTFSMAGTLHHTAAPRMK